MKEPGKLLGLSYSLMESKSENIEPENKTKMNGNSDEIGKQ